MVYWETLDASFSTKLMGLGHQMSGLRLHYQLENSLIRDGAPTEFAQNGKCITASRNTSKPTKQQMMGVSTSLRHLAKDRWEGAVAGTN